MRMLSTIQWNGRNLDLLDQTKLPLQTEYLCIDTAEGVRNAIAATQVRGAPAIGVAAAYGMVLAARQIKEKSFKRFFAALEEEGKLILAARPAAAVTLSWAIGRMLDAARSYGRVQGICVRLEQEAGIIHYEDIATNKRIGENALGLLKNGYSVLTHCNAGVLATTKYGTALSALYLAKHREMDIKVYVTETRPRLQGASLTAFELMHADFDVTLICDSAAAMLMSQGKIDAVLVGCNRIAANGDVANKIGTLGLAVAAKHFGIPMYVAAPSSAIDLGCESGAQIPIEERSEDEITHIAGVRIAPKGVKAYNPSFDITPAENITAIITELGIARPPFEEGLRQLF